MMDFDVAHLMTCFGALAETLGFYKRELINNGFSEENAVKMCVALQMSMIASKDKEFD